MRRLPRFTPLPSAAVSRAGLLSAWREGHRCVPVPHLLHCGGGGGGALMWGRSLRRGPAGARGPGVSAVTLSKRFCARPLPTRPLVMVKQHSQRAWGNGEVNWGLMGASLVDLMESLRFGNTICTWKEQGKLWAGLQRGAWWALGPHRCCYSHHACVSPGVPAGHSTTVGGAAGPLTRPQALVKVPPSG